MVPGFILTGALYCTVIIIQCFLFFYIVCLHPYLNYLRPNLRGSLHESELSFNLNDTSNSICVYMGD